MSKYYNIKGLKVRVSDHEPNFSMNRLRGSADVELYVKSLEGDLLSIEGQIEAICEKRGYDIADFSEIIEEWKDGAYDVNVFKPEKQEDENTASLEGLIDLKKQRAKNVSEKLEGYNLSRFAKHPEIKALSEKTGVSQSAIKKHFGIR